MSLRRRVRALEHGVDDEGGRRCRACGGLQLVRGVTTDFADGPRCICQTCAACEPINRLVRLAAQADAEEAAERA
ncbi:MAG: hypothetical protein HYU88_04440 [Chloroflexi bacterium]|nr:hypothetical protein [Chloroflexota bacterium]